MKRATFAVAAALATTALGLAGCETATPYQPINAQSSSAQGGYSDQQIESNRWRVEFSGNSLTSRQTVERYLLFRAAQLTVNNGFDWFESVNRHTEKQTDYVGDSFYNGWGPDWGLYRPGFGWGWGYGGFGPYGGFGYGGFGGSSFDINQVTRYQASVEIIMGHGQKPADDPRAYDARQVIQHLEGTIKYPKAN